MICPHCNKIIPHPYAESRKRARKKWRTSPKGRAWTKPIINDQKLNQEIMKNILKV